MRASTERLRPGPDGRLEVAAEGEGFALATDHQLGIFLGACNECSNCKVYCPEDGAPFRVKERIFSSREDFETSGADGSFRDGDVLLSRIAGRDYRLAMDDAKQRARLSVEQADVFFDWQSMRFLAGRSERSGFVLDTSSLWRMKTVWKSIYGSAKPNPANPGGQ